jgi:protein-S-isoprenylcysteine O-methyltransferase Ste14
MRLLRLLRSSPFRTFVLYPMIVVGVEWLLNRGRLAVDPWFLPVMAWGYLQYRLVGIYRVRRGGGGPGMDNPPERLVTTGPFAWSRNPMYLGHFVFLAGLALSLHSLFAAATGAAAAVAFHSRVRRDERRLAEQFGQPYLDYAARVKRWIPALF